MGLTAGNRAWVGAVRADGRAGWDSIVPTAGLDGPDRRDLALPYRDGRPVQVHRGAAVRRQHFPPRADGDERAGRLDPRVLLGKLEYLFALGPLDDGRAEVPGDGLAAGVQHVLAGPGADDGRQNGEG